MAKNTIILKNYLNVFMEKDVSEAMTPGMLVEYTTTAEEIKKHATADGAVAPIMFIIENALEGEGIDDAYADGDKARVWYPTRGDNVYALIEDGEDIAVGDLLVSAGNGKLKEREGASDGEVPRSVVAVALEALDLTSSSGAETTYRCEVEIV